MVSVTLIPLRSVKDRTEPAVVPDPNFDDTLSPPSAPIARFASSPTSSSPVQPFAFPPSSTFTSPGPGSGPAMIPIPSFPPRRRSSAQSPLESVPGTPTLPGTPLLGSDRTQAPDFTTPRVGLLDIFLVEVFVMNDWAGGDCAGFAISVPPALGAPGAGGAPGADGAGARTASIVALENDVRIGPLAPGQCASARLRFLAVRPGCHALEELRLVHLGSGMETRLVRPLEVVVE